MGLCAIATGIITRRIDVYVVISGDQLTDEHS